MLIGLISDTHIAFPTEEVPPQIKSALSGVDLILHAGDIWIPSVLDELESVAPITAAWGDDDMPEDFSDDSRMMEGHSLLFDGITIWLMHKRPTLRLPNPSGPAQPSGRGGEDPKSLPDVVIFGHTHFATIEPYKGVLFVNPGSATLPSYVPKLGSIALLTINSGAVEARIVPLG